MNLSDLWNRITRKPKATKIELDPDQEKEILKALADVFQSRSRPGIKPPNDDEWTWAEWNKLMQSNTFKGWSYCRFANRIGHDRVGFVIGIVSGEFGVFERPFKVCDELAQSEEEVVLSCITHLPTGLGFGVFQETKVAVTACEAALAARNQWTLDPNDKKTWSSALEVVRESWKFHGIAPSTSRHAHLDAMIDSPLKIFERSDETIMAGKPEKTS